MHLLKAEAWPLSREGPALYNSGCLYLSLSLHALKRDTEVSWPALNAQFGAGIALAGGSAAHRAQAGLRFAPSMRQRLDLERLYAKAVRALPDVIDDQRPLPVPERCPVTLDELLSED